MKPGTWTLEHSPHTTVLFKIELCCLSFIKETTCTRSYCCNCVTSVYNNCSDYHNVYVWLWIETSSERSYIKCHYTYCRGWCRGRLKQLVLGGKKENTFTVGHKVHLSSLP